MKNRDWLKLEFFTPEEIDDASFGCSHGFDRISVKALVMLDTLRKLRGKPITLSCAYRTVEWDISKERSGNSQHCKGTAFDIKISKLSEAAEIIAIASRLGFKGFAINDKKGFVHIDMRESDNVEVWDY